ncbi:hypothetical protein BTO11_00870 [Psychrosphaera saromensis]|uniref:Uncharacterized protein n=1 Tax=Psychrosphaera saromensis TaxID=716813 RepID=A0A2S7UQS4_9GAMM|nr:hypothetical protein BTO11_00870 [Psychrosphaera saromensis]
MRDKSSFELRVARGEEKIELFRVQNQFELLLLLVPRDSFLVAEGSFEWRVASGEKKIRLFRVQNQFKLLLLLLLVPRNSTLVAEGSFEWRGKDGATSRLESRHS